MDLWFLRDPRRLETEIQAIRDLEDRAAWLGGADWLLDEALAIDAAIVAHDHTYRVRLTYPAVFPFAPPAVRPIDADLLWSGHQYRDGTLCLEWGPDTWRPEVTGAQVLESAYRLLEIENPSGIGDRGIAPSRHSISPGQALRGTIGRVYAEPEFYTYLDQLPRDEVGLLEGRILHQRRSYALLIQGVRPPERPPWDATAIPAGVRGTEENYWLSQGLYFTWPAPNEALIGVEDLTGITSALREAGYRGPTLDGPGWWMAFNLEERPAFVLVVDRVRENHFFMLFSEDGNLVRPLSIVRSRPTESAIRIPASLAVCRG